MAVVILLRPVSIGRFFLFNVHLIEQEFEHAVRLRAESDLGSEGIQFSFADGGYECGYAIP